MSTDDLYVAWRQVAALHDIWRAMRRRCENPKVKDYRWYGARGIRVCERWQDFRAFLDDLLVEIGPRPVDAHESGALVYSLDRINVNGHYEPGNIRWATSHQQAVNRRPVKFEVNPGDRFGRLLVVQETEPIVGPHRRKPGGVTQHRAALCRCDCGVEKVIKVGALIQGHAKSCGCLRRENMKVLAAERFGPGGAFHNSGNLARQAVS